jgi:hypothetical protein
MEDFPRPASIDQPYQTPAACGAGASDMDNESIKRALTAYSIATGVHVVALDAEAMRAAIEAASGDFTRAYRLQEAREEA